MTRCKHCGAACELRDDGESYAGGQLHLPAVCRKNLVAENARLEFELTYQIGLLARAHALLELEDIGPTLQKEIASHLWGSQPEGDE